MKIDWEYLFTGKPSGKTTELMPASVKMTNWSLRMAWKGGAGLTAITFRTLAGLVHAIARNRQRDRNNW